MDKQIWVAQLPERAVYAEAFNVGAELAYVAGQKGYHPIFPGYGRTDITRQRITDAFLQESKQPTDTLVMFDIDHNHAANTVERLVRHDKPIVVALAFRRGEPYDACAGIRDTGGDIHHLAEFDRGLQQMNWVGHSAIAIQRHVFETLLAAGHEFFWQYEYLKAEPDKKLGKRAPSEDIYFSRICDELGIGMYCDTDFEAPHMILGYIDKEWHMLYRADHPEAFGEIVKASEFTRGDYGKQIQAEPAADGGHSDSRLEQPRLNRAANLVN
jgi:hypothetical protein